MTKKNKPKHNDKEQFARFIEVAEQIESDNPQKAFEEALKKIVKKKRVSKSKMELPR